MGIFPWRASRSSSADKWFSNDEATEDAVKISRYINVLHNRPLCKNKPVTNGFPLKGPAILTFSRHIKTRATFTLEKISFNENRFQCQINSSCNIHMNKADTTHRINSDFKFWADNIMAIRNFHLVSKTWEKQSPRGKKPSESSCLWPGEVWANLALRA